MKHNWEYKQLGDVCDSINGLWTGKNPPFIHVGVIRNTNFTRDCRLDSSDIFYTDVEVKAFEKRKLQKGDIIIEKSGGSEKQPVGRPILFNIDGLFSFSNFTATLRLKTNDIIPEFLQKTLFALYIQGETRRLQSRTTGLYNLNWKEFLLLKIPIPPMGVQEQIVAELDKINELIEQNRELLRHLDALAQSIFYDTFGDPITNPKGWEIHLFSDVFKLNSGDGLSAKQIIPGQYPVYGGNGIVGYHQNYNVDGNNVIIGRVGALCGNVRNVKNKAFVTDNAFIVTQLKALNQLYTTFMLNIINLRQYAKTVAQPVISNVGLKNILIQVPPLAMQEQFASKIEAIEAQKATVEESIAELQTLLDSRMDYWFN